MKVQPFINKHKCYYMRVRAYFCF